MSDPDLSRTGSVRRAWWQAFRHRWFEWPPGMRDLWREQDLERARRDALLLSRESDSG